MLEDLDQNSFEYFKRYNSQMISTHESEFMACINPDLMRAHYRTFKEKNYKDQLSNWEDEEFKEHVLILTRIFGTVNTVLPNLYYQNPRILAIPELESTPESAAILTSAMNYYMRVLKQKEENQNCVMNSVFFGIAWKKIGYQTMSIPMDETPETAMTPEELLRDKSEPGQAIDNLESGGNFQYVRKETLFNRSESPLNVLIDHNGTWRDFKVITHRVKRSLHDLSMFAGYDKTIVEEIRQKYRYNKGSRFDDRDIILDLNEMTIEQRNGMWVMCYVDQHEKPLRYDKALVQDEFPWKPLVLTNEPDVRYPISHLRVASNGQLWVDNLATLIIDIISRQRNQLIINEKALMPGQLQAIQKNKTQGIIRANQPVNAGVFANLASTPLGSDVLSVLAILQQNVTEVIGSDAQTVSGKSINETLGQDKIALMGTQMREAGSLDRVRDWLIDQKQLEGKILQKFSAGEMKLRVEPSDFDNPEAANITAPKVYEFMTPNNPMPLSNTIKGSFNYNINIYEAIKLDKTVMAKEMDTMIAIAATTDMDEVMMARGMRLRIDKLWEQRVKMFEYLDIDNFVEKLTPQQVATARVAKILQERQGLLPGAEQRMQGEQRMAEQAAKPKPAEVPA